MNPIDPGDRIVPVILCGGSGTRLWPRSRKHRPKPFLPLIGERTLLQQSLDRVSDPAVFAPPIIVAGANHVAHVESHAAMADGGCLIVEPAARNTAPAIALAATILPRETVMLVCPSDHHIADAGAFAAAARDAAAIARDGFLVSLAIAPNGPETGYGYIRRGDRIAGGHKVAEFVEKPSRDTAEAFLATGQYVWNGGIFAFRAGDYLDELSAFRPRMAEHVGRAVTHGERDGATMFPAAEPFAAIAAESIDYAVMENTARAALVVADMGWSDIGSWDALMAARDGLADPDGNIALGDADLLDCCGVMIDSDGPRVSVVGLEDVIVVVDGNDVLVTSRAAAQQVGRLPGANGP